MCRKTIIILLIAYSTISSLLARENILKFDKITIDNGLSQNSVHSIVKDRYGFMWFGTWGGVSRFDGYSIKVFRASEDDSTAISNNRVTGIITDSVQNVWLSTVDYEFVFRFNYDTETFTRFTYDKVPTSILDKLGHSRGSFIKHFSNNDYAFDGSDNGLLVTNRRTGRQNLYQTNRYNPFSISDNTINAIYIDDCDNLWIGTQNGGVNYTNLRGKPFEYYTMSSQGDGLIDNVIRAIGQEQNGKLWVGTESKGITVIDRNPDGYKYTHYGEDKLISTYIRSIFTDSKGNIWIGTKGGLDKYDPRTRKFRHYYAYAKGGLPNPWVFWVTEDHNGNIWVATFNGIAKYDKKNDGFLNYDPVTTLKNEKTRVVFEDSKYNLWVAGEGGGITRLSRDSSNGFLEKLTPTHYTHIRGNENSLINNMVLAMAEDASHKLWIGTNSGLSHFDPENGNFKHFTVRTGFSDDLIMGLLSDGKENIWISHKKGLTCMNIHTLVTREFNAHDGLQGLEFTQNAYYCNSRTGEMFFGGANGLNSFFPDSIGTNPYKLKPILTTLKVMNQMVETGSKIDGRVILPKSLFCSDKITLTWWDKNFSIEFSALNFVNPMGSKFKYVLEGVDNQWIYTDAANRIASYSHLPAGTYTFKVYAANSDGLWSDSPATIEIEVLPPWWYSWWAKAIYLLIVLAIVWFVYRFISTRIEFRNRLLIERLKNEKSEELAQMKMSFFTKVSHEFRTPLTLILDPLEKLIAGNLSTGKMQYYHNLMHRNAKQLLTLINQLLDFRKLESGNMTLKTESIELIIFVRDNAASFENMAIQHNIRFAVECSENQLIAEIDVDKVSKILNNLLANAFKFTPDNGEIKVLLLLTEAEPRNILIKVSDTGIGIKPEKLPHIFEVFYQAENSDYQSEGSGIGLALVKELVQLHDGKISVESEAGIGTCFCVSLPYLVVSEESDSMHELSEDVLINNSASKEEVSDSGNEEESARPLLLVVDDNEDVRQYIHMNFSELYRIITAENGLVGFQAATENIPDIIISDIMMPGLNGTEMCKMLKTDERTSHIPVIMLTAKQSDESKVEGFETGADAYITKPFSTMVLGAQMDSLLKQRLKLRQLFSNGSLLELKKIAINITDEAFMNKVVKVVNDNIEDVDFNPDILAEKLKMSRSLLQRKVKAMTNQTLHDFITTLRMNKALELLLSGDYSISEIAYKVGYSLPTNFTRSFVKQFGETPSKYIDVLKK
jgi:signal transduction histidine kinase/ligand-binding sensor domain-containing protein/DNA-binding response OmpR family regulator